MPRSGRRGSKP